MSVSERAHPPASQGRERRSAAGWDERLPARPLSGCCDRWWLAVSFSRSVVICELAEGGCGEPVRGPSLLEGVNRLQFSLGLFSPFPCENLGAAWLSPGLVSPEPAELSGLTRTGAGSLWPWGSAASPRWDKSWHQGC